jgi:hypothetical protein
MAILTASAALVVQMPDAQAQETVVARSRLEPTPQALDLEAGNAKKFAAARSVSQLPGRSYEAYARLPFQKNVTRVKYRVSGTGEAVFEGDMILGDAEEVQRWSDQYDRLGPMMAISFVDSAFLWPGGVVPYRISDEFRNKAATAIKDGVNELNSKTNVRLIPYDKNAHKDYVDIVVMKEKEAGGGQSEVGRQGKRQKLHLKADVDSSRTVIHELMHALGFRHEHTRADRDEFIEIRWRNILDDDLKEQFRVHEGDFVFADYDKGSIMHYDGFAFSKPCDIVQLANGQSCGQCASVQDWRNAAGRCMATIVDRKTKDPVAGSSALSAQDVAAINALYPEEERGTTLPPVSQLRSLRTTIERVITRAGPGESGVCGTNTDYLAKITAGPVVAFRGAYENRFDPDRFNVWEADKPERSNDLRPGNWRLVTPVSPNNDLMRVDVYAYDHDDAICGGKDDVIDINPTGFALLRLLLDTSTGEVFHLGIEDSPLPDMKTYPILSKVGSVFNGSTGEFITLKFNGLLDGKADYTDEAEIHLKIELLS